MGIPGQRPPLRDWALKYLSHHFGSPLSRFHEWFAGELNGLHGRRGSRLNILAPRGAAKSTWILADVLYAIVHGLERFIVWTADTAIQAEKYLDTVREELEGNELLKADYPHACGKGSVWRSAAIVTKNGIRVEALGTGAKLRGRKHRQYRPSLIIVDDPQNSDHIISELQRSRSWSWLTKDVSNAGEPATNIVSAGTALHEDCIVCKLQRTPGWRSEVFRSVELWPERMDLWAKWERFLQDYGIPEAERSAKAEAFYQANRPEMERGARVLWPDREPLYALMLHRASIGELAFNFEKQNDPADPEARAWPPSYFTGDRLWFDTWPTGLAVRVLYLDPSLGENEDCDYWAYTLYGRDGLGQEYVEAWLGKQDAEAMVRLGIEIIRANRLHALGVESNGFQRLLAPKFRQAAKDTATELPRIYLINNSDNKRMRILRLGEPLHQRRMRFRSTPGTRMLFDQLRLFPTHDYFDGPDSLEGARRLAIDLFNKMQPGAKG